MKIMKKQLNPEERQRMVDLLNEARKQGEHSIASMVELAITMNDKGEYDKFQEVFSNE